MRQRSEGYLVTLRQNPGFARLWIGQIISLLGDWFSYVAVLGLVLHLSNSGLAVALTMLARAVPYTAFGMISGVVLDRWDRKRVLIVADVLRGLLAVTYLLIREPGQVWLVYLVGALMQSCSAFFNPGLHAVVPSICRDEDRMNANALIQITHGFTMIIGSAVGGFLVPLVGRDWAFILNGATFFLSTLTILFVAIPLTLREHDTAGPWAQLQEGVSFIRSNATVFGIILRRMGERLGAGFNILLSVYAVQVWQEGEKGIGWLYAILGFGLIIGSWIAKWVGEKASPNRMRWAIGWGNVSQAVFWLAFALSPNLWVGGLMIIMMVASDILTNVLEVTLLQRMVPNHLLGRVFAARETLLTLAWAIALTVTGAVLEKTSPQLTAVGIAGVIFLTACCWLVLQLVGKLRTAEEQTGVTRAG